MPCNLKRYGPGWKVFSNFIRHTRAGDRCECTGECGKHHKTRCDEIHRRPARFARGKIVLTTAHLCACDPPCRLPHHVRAMCQACHLRLDITIHLAHRRATREAIRAQRALPFDLKLPPGKVTLDPTPGPSDAS